MATAKKKGLPRHHIHITRMTPKRGDELLAGGSLYWVIRGEIAAREKIIAIEPFRDKDGIGRCRLVMQPKVIAVSPRPMRAFQGWRYLTPDGAARSRQGRGQRRGDAGAAAPRTARSRVALGFRAAHSGRTSMYRSRAASFQISGIALLGARRRLRNSMSFTHIEQFRLEPAAYPAPELAAIQNVFDSPAPKAADRAAGRESGSAAAAQRDGLGDRA